MPKPSPEADAAAQPQRALSLLDSTSIIVGIIIGSGIYQSSPDIAAGACRFVHSFNSLANGPAWTGSEWPSAAAAGAIVAVWLVGGLVALIGAMCYAELATAFPKAGGTYVFLSEAFGRDVGFAFAWLEFWIVRPGNVGAIAFIMAGYTLEIFIPHKSGSRLELVVAAGAIVLISALNALGLRAGKWTQNVLTVGKLLGLAALVGAALTLPAAASQPPPPTSTPLTLWTALIFVMFAYGGWADMSFVAAEVRDPGRNIWRALLLGTLAVTGIYLAVTAGFLHVLGPGGLAQSQAVAAEVMSRRLGNYGSHAISLLIAVSCLGAINGTLFTGARVYYALGMDHPTFRWLSAWNERIGVPLRSLFVQTVVTVGLVIGFGLNPAAFNRLVIFTVPFFWGFIGLAGVALLVLRWKGATAHAAYHVPLFPIIPLIFIGTSAAMVYAAVDYAYHNRSPEALWAAGVIVAGIIMGAVDRLARREQLLSHG